MVNVKFLMDPDIKFAVDINSVRKWNRPPKGSNLFVRVSETNEYLAEVVSAEKVRTIKVNILHGPQKVQGVRDIPYADVVVRRLQMERWLASW